MKLLNSQRIFERDIYELADKEAFQFSFELLRKHKFSISSSMTDIKFWLPNFDQAFWLPHKKELSVLPGKQMVSGYELVHQTIHFLIVRRYGSALKGMPRLTALAECIAGATGLYFNLSYLKMGGDPSKLSGLSFYANNAKSLNTSAENPIRQRLENPFSAFKESVRVADEIVLFLLDAFRESTNSNQKMNLNILIALLSSSEEFIFLRHKDFPNFVLFIAAHCGLESSQRDEDCAGELAHILAASSTYKEFLEFLAF
jgi:hypothetical protein